jgi:GGDEF domain-containing protein/CHASE3 domain sensor protein
MFENIGISLSLRQKIFLGYAVMILFIIIVGVYATWSLNTLNKITETVIFEDITTLEKFKKLNDNIQAQDLYEKRYLAFQDMNSEDAFWERSNEFKSLITDIGKNYPSFSEIVDDLSATHESYNETFRKEVQSLKRNQVQEAKNLSSSEMRNHFSKILSLLKTIEIKLRDQQRQHINESSMLSERALIVTISLNILSIFFGILFAYIITNNLTSFIEKFKDATYSIQSGDFDSQLDIKGADELADLAISFKEMSTRLKELEAVHLDANPLTKLPGNLAIEKELLTRLNEQENFSFCLIDLDNFKAFNDRYSFARGSDLIFWLGNDLQEILKTLGSEEDFLGHIGGDDFVLICAPERTEPLCNMIIDHFDKGVSKFYDTEDLERGYIVSLDRDDKPAIFPILTVSIAVVNTDRTVVREPKEVAEKVAELKQYAKTFPKSIYVVDRRRTR